MTMSFPAAARDQTLLRRVNELSVLGALRDGTPRTMGDIAELTGLSWRTANGVAEALHQFGWLAEVDVDASGKRMGRPARRYRFRAEAGHVVGIDVGARSVGVFVADLSGAVVGRHRRKVAPQESASKRLAHTRTAIEAALADAGISAHDVWAAALGSTGIVNREGVVTASVVLPGWSGIDLAARLGGVLACPIVVANDCNLAALGERWQRPGADSLIYLLAGLRLGVGLIIGGRVHYGAAGAAGEIGEMQEFGWNDTAARLASAAPDPGAERGRAAHQVFAAARDHEPGAVAAVDGFAADVARGLTAIVLTVDPELVVLGGEFTYAADLLLPRLTAALTPVCPHVPQLEVSALGDDAVILGAIRLALDTLDHRLNTLDSNTALTPTAVRSR